MPFATLLEQMLSQIEINNRLAPRQISEPLSVAYSVAFIFLSIAVQINGDGVDAIAQARGCRAVVEDVAQVGIAAGAGDFDAAHAKAQVFVLIDAVGVNGVKKAGPSAVRVEFLV